VFTRNTRKREKKINPIPLHPGWVFRDQGGGENKKSAVCFIPFAIIFHNILKFDDECNLKYPFAAQICVYRSPNLNNPFQQLFLYIILTLYYNMIDDGIGIASSATLLTNHIAAGNFKSPVACLRVFFNVLNCRDSENDLI